MRGLRFGRVSRKLRWVAGLLVGLAAAAYVGDHMGVFGIRPILLAARVPRLSAAAITLAPRVHMLGGLAPSSAYVVETPNGLILFDTGLESNASRLRAQMAQLGLDWRKIRVIFLTHAHGDHSGGAQFLREATGAKVYAGEKDAGVLSAGGPREAFFSTFYMPDQSTHATTVDVPLNGGEELDMGGEAQVFPIATPGHTPGSMCYLVLVSGLRLLVTGDIIMKLRGDETAQDQLSKPLGTYSAYLAPKYRGNAADLLASLKRLRSMAPPDLVLPGHPSADPSPESPCIAPSRWRKLLDDGIRDMRQLVDRQEKDGRDFLDSEPKVLLPGLYYLGEFRGTSAYGLIASDRLFLVNAPGGEGLTEFVATTLERLGARISKPSAVLLTDAGPIETAGLAELVRKTCASVVVASKGFATITNLVPAGTKVLSADDLAGKGWFPVTAVSLHGRGIAPIAYLLPWDKKSVLFAGQVPVVMTQPTGLRLFAEFASDKGNVHDYLASLAMLDALRPDLWLPLIPTDAQNANLYDDDWANILDGNRVAIKRNAALRERRRDSMESP
jgi:glyoxylase-like metal-dependent hydrolase (beta-lactamase superfamily II)